MAILKLGEKVTIYYDPLTEEKAEGRATLKEFVALSPSGTQPVTEQWKVNFEDDVPSAIVLRILKRYGKNNRTFGFELNEAREDA